MCVCAPCNSFSIHADVVGGPGRLWCLTAGHHGSILPSRGAGAGFSSLGLAPGKAIPAAAIIFLQAVQWGMAASNSGVRSGTIISFFSARDSAISSEEESD